jgi:DNA-binding NarL/FixJ family response regulator
MQEDVPNSVDPATRTLEPGSSHPSPARDDGLLSVLSQLPPASFEERERYRILLLCRHGLSGDCLRSLLHEQGYEVVVHLLDEPVKKRPLPIDLVVVVLGSNRAADVDVARRRLEEARGAVGAPAIGLVENIDREAASNLASLGLEAFVGGCISAKVVLATIHLVKLVGAKITAQIHIKSDHPNELPGLEPVRIPEKYLDDDDFSAIGNFTKREVALLTRLRQGMQNKMIAYELGIAESTVKVHLRNIMSKLHAANRTQVAYMLAGNKSDIAS